MEAEAVGGGQLLIPGVMLSHRALFSRFVLTRSSLRVIPVRNTRSLLPVRLTCRFSSQADDKQDLHQDKMNKKFDNANNESVDLLDKKVESVEHKADGSLDKAADSDLLDKKVESVEHKADGSLDKAANSAVGPENLPKEIKKEEDDIVITEAPSDDAAYDHSRTSLDSSEDFFPEQAGTLWFDGLYPIRRSRWDIRFLLRKITLRFKGATFHETSILPHLKSTKYPLKIDMIIPRQREAGCFVKFHTKSRDSTPQKVEDEVQRSLRESKAHGFLSFAPVRATLVHGDPFMEDLNNRFPSNKLKVFYKGDDITEDSLYKLLRGYGRIHEIIKSDKDKYFLVEYTLLNSAVSARNCLHNFSYKKTKPGTATTPEISSTTLLTFVYEPLPPRINKLLEQFNKNPKLFFPILVVIATLLTILIFDPLRSFFIESFIIDRFSFKTLLRHLLISADYGMEATKKVLQYFPLGVRTWALNKLDKKTEGKSGPTWVARKEDEEVFRSWLRQAPERVLLLGGPEGSGKHELINQVVVEKTKNSAGMPVIRVDLSLMMEASDEELVDMLAQKLHFFPAFTLTNWGSSMMVIITNYSPAAGDSP